MGALRKAAVYLGLADEDETYAEYDESGHADDSRYAGSARAGSQAYGLDDEDEETHVSRGATAATPSSHASQPVRTRESDSGSSAGAPVTQLPRRVPVRQVVQDAEVATVNRITTIHPRTYNEAKNIGESFREGTPVIMNLTDLDDSDAKRLVDFAAGLVFGLQGSIERVTNKVFLLSPAHVEVTSTDGEPARAKKTLFNQS